MNNANVSKLKRGLLLVWALGWLFVLLHDFEVIHWIVVLIFFALLFSCRMAIVSAPGAPYARLNYRLGWVVSCVSGCLILAGIESDQRFHREILMVAMRTQINSFGSALTNYQIDNGTYPIGTNGLAALIQKPPGATNWQGPYLMADAIPHDYWDQPYGYLCPGQHTASGFPYDLWSPGPPGKNQPVANWLLATNATNTGGAASK